MLPSTARVRTSAEFDEIFKRGQIAHGPNLSVRALSTEPPPRFGFMVGRRVSIRATVRNRLKRRLRAIVRSCYSNLAPAMVVVVAKPGALSRTHQELAEELTNLLKNLKLLT